jgi:hypothetical protein
LRAFGYGGAEVKDVLLPRIHLILSHTHEADDL